MKNLHKHDVVRFVVGVLSLLVLLAAVLAPGVTVTAQTSLPLENLGLEHLDIVVPDPAVSARFYARIFRTTLHLQPVRDMLRYFVLLGDLPADRQVGYIAIGAAQGRAPSIGHYCVLAKAYARDAFAAALRSAGLPAQATAPGPIGMWPDPDGLELQLFQPPAGLVTAAGLGLEQTGGAVRIAHYAIRVAAFDRDMVTSRLREVGARAQPAPDEPDGLRFADDNGIIVELRVASAG